MARIEELAAKIEQARVLRRESVREVKQLIVVQARKLLAKIPAKVTNGNIQYEGIRLDGLKHVTEEKAKQLERYAVKEGDILFARMGTVGRCCVVPKNIEGWLINYHIIRVALDKSQVEPRYIYWTIQTSGDIEEYLGETTRGSTRKGVNSKIVSELPVCIPPLPEQRRIVAYLDSLHAKVEVVKRHQAATATQLETLLPAVLDRAFKGEL